MKPTVITCTSPAGGMQLTFVVLIQMITFVVCGTSYRPNHRNMSPLCTVEPDQSKVRCGSSVREATESDYTTQLGSLSDLLEHCRTVNTLFNVGGHGSGPGLGGCRPSIGEKCTAYKTCMMSLATKDQISPLHIDLGNAFYVTEPTTITTFYRTITVENTLVYKTATMRMCPETVRPTSHFMDKSSSSCTYYYENGDIPDVVGMPFTGYMLKEGLLSYEDLKSGAWYRDMLHYGPQKVEQNLLYRFVAEIEERFVKQENILKEMTKNIMKITLNGTLLDVLMARIGEIEEPTCIGEYCNNGMIRYVMYGSGRIMVVFQTFICGFGLAVAIVMFVVGVWVKAISPVMKRRREEKDEGVPDGEINGF